MVWAFSIYLEAVAILPQLFLLQKQGEVENLTSHYVAALGAYRALYLLNWVYRYFTEEDYQQRCARARHAITRQPRRQRVLSAAVSAAVSSGGLSGSGGVSNVQKRAYQRWPLQTWRLQR